MVKPSSQGSALGIKFARSAADVPAALVAAFSYDSKVLLERYVDGRDLAVSILDGEPLPIVEAVPRDEAFYDFEARYEIGRTDFVCPADLPDGLTERAHELASPPTRCSAAAAFARVDLMLGSDGEPTVLEANTDPGPDRHQPAAPGGRGGRRIDGFDRARRRTHAWSGEPAAAGRLTR